MSQKLHEWTGSRWLITLGKSKGQKTYSATRDEKRKELINQEKSTKIYEKFKNIFSDGELLEVKKED